MKLGNHDVIGVGAVGNYYGCLCVKVENGLPYWSIEDWDGHCWEEITPDLYLALMKFNDENYTDD